MQRMGWTATKDPYHALAVRMETARIHRAAVETARRSLAPRPTSWKAPGHLRPTHNRP